MPLIQGMPHTLFFTKSSSGQNPTWHVALNCFLLIFHTRLYAVHTFYCSMSLLSWLPQTKVPHIFYVLISTLCCCWLVLVYMFWLLIAWLYAVCFWCSMYIATCLETRETGLLGISWFTLCTFQSSMRYAASAPSQGLQIKASKLDLRPFRALPVLNSRAYCFSTTHTSQRLTWVSAWSGESIVFVLMWHTPATFLLVVSVYCISKRELLRVFSCRSLRS